MRPHPFNLCPPGCDITHPQVGKEKEEKEEEEEEEEENSHLHVSRGREIIEVCWGGERKGEGKGGSGKKL